MLTTAGIIEQLVSLKVVLKILHQQIFRKFEQDFTKMQFGFRNALGPRESLFTFHMLAKRCLEVNQPVYVFGL